VQNGAPVDLLIGTDLQSQLGFAFLEPDVERENGTTTDLLSGEPWKGYGEHESGNLVTSSEPLSSESNFREQSYILVKTICFQYIADF